MIFGIKDFFKRIKLKGVSVFGVMWEYEHEQKREIKRDPFSNDSKNNITDERSIDGIQEQWRKNVILFFVENIPDECIYDNFMITKDRSINIYYKGKALANTSEIEREIYKCFRVSASIIAR